MKRMLSILLALVLVISVSSPAAAAQPIRARAAGDNAFTEGEPNDTLQTDNALANDYTVYGTLSPTDQADCFRFRLTEKTDVAIEVASLQESLLCGITADGSTLLAQAIQQGYYNDGTCAFLLTVTLDAGEYFLVMMDAYRQSNEYLFYTLFQPAAPAVNPFADVTEADWFYDSVLWALENGITAGISADRFGPNNACTRGQVVTFLWRAMGCPEPESGENPFSDVMETDYFYKAVLWAVEQGITSGTGGGKFSPNSPCTRNQVVTFLWRAMGQPTPDMTQNPFHDVPEGIYYYNPVLWAVENGITSGTSGTTFAPNADCTRAQVVTFLYRTDALEDTPVEPEPTEPEPTEPEPTEPEPTEPEPTEPEPTEPEPTEPEPTEPEPTEPEPTEPEPTEPEPTEPEPTEPEPTEPEPTEPEPTEPEPTEPEPTEPEPTEPEPTEPEPTEPEPTETEPTEPVPSEPVLVAEAVDLAYLTQMPANAVQDVCAFSGGQVELKKATNGGYHSYKGLSTEVIEAYVEALQANGFTLVDTYKSSRYKSWGLTVNALPDLATREQTYTDTPCHVCIWVGGGNSRIDIVDGLQMYDLGLRMDGNHLDFAPQGQSLGAGLYRLPDGSYQTDDGRLTARAGQATVLRDGEHCTGEARWELKDGRYHLTLTDYSPDEQVTVTLRSDAAKQDAIFQKRDLKDRAFTLALTAGGKTRSQESQFDAISLRVMYWEPEGDGVLYLYARTTDGGPEEVEALYVISMAPDWEPEAPTEPELPEGTVAAPFDAEALFLPPDNAVQDIRPFTYGQVLLESSANGTLNTYENLTDEVIEAYVAMLQENGFTLVDVYDESLSGIYRSWGLVCNAMPELATMEQQYSDTPCHICIWTGSGIRRIDLVDGLELWDLGLRIDGTQVDVLPDTRSLGAGLIRLEDGSYQTTDGRLTAKAGQAAVIRNGEAMTGKAQHLDWATYTTFTTDSYAGEDSIVFTLKTKDLKQGLVLLKEDLEHTDFTFKLTVDGKTIQQKANSTAFEHIAVRVMYYEPQGDAVLYLHAVTTGDYPVEVEALYAINLAPVEEPEPDDPTEPTEPEPTEPEEIPEGMLAGPVDLEALRQRPENGVQDIRYFTYGQVRLDGKPGGTYNNYKELPLEIIEAYVEMLQQNGYTLVDAFEESFSGTYRSWGLVRDDMPELETISQQYSDTPCHINIWTAKGSAGTKTYRIDLTEGLVLCDLGLRMDGEDFDLTPGGESLGAGLIRLEDGSYQTSDGRLTAQVGEAIVVRDGVGLTGKASWDTKGSEQVFTVNGYRPGESIVFGLEPEDLKTGAIFQKYDLEPEDYTFQLTVGEETWSQNYNATAFRTISVRVMYYEPEGDAVLYIHTATTVGEPMELEIFCAVSTAPEPVKPMPEIDPEALFRVDGGVNRTITITTDQVLEIFYDHREWDSMYHTFDYIVTEGPELVEMYGSGSSRFFFPTGTGVVIVKMEYHYTEKEPDVLTGIIRDNPKSHQRTYSIIIVDP